MGRTDTAEAPKDAEREARMGHPPEVRGGSSGSTRCGQAVNATAETSPRLGNLRGTKTEPLENGQTLETRGAGTAHGARHGTGPGTGTLSAQPKPSAPSISAQNGGKGTPKNFAQAPQPDAGEWTPTGYVLDWFVSTAPAFGVTARRLDGWNADSQRLFRHVLASGSLLRADDARWVPVSFDLLHGRRSVGLEGRLPDADERGLVAAGLLELKPHVAPQGHERGKGRCAEYRVPAEVQAEYDAALGRGAFVNLFTGKATTKRSKTKRADENRHPFPPLIQAGMDGIPFGLYDRPRAAAHVAAALAVAEDAERRASALLGATSTAAFHVRAVREAAACVRDAKRARSASPFDAETCAAIEEAERLRGRYGVDNAALFALRRQTVEELPNGVARYTAAWEPQTFGRITDRGGLLQNATREMKAAAWGSVPAVRNYDLKSSQPRQLAAWFDRAGIPTGELETVLLGDKATAAASVGITVEAWKRATMGLVMGGTLYKTLGKGTDADGEPRGEVVASIVTGAFSGVTPAGAYAVFQAKTRALYADLKAFRRYLVGVWLPANEYHANGGRRYVRNATGTTFDVSAMLDKNGQLKGKTGRLLAAFLLQGAEAAFVYTLTALQKPYGFTVLANEHDGLVTVGEIPEEAVQIARETTGQPTAELVEKPFASVAA